jgi:hypothetical protein
VVWETHGASVLERLAVTDPGKLAQIAYGLLPRDVFISVEQRTSAAPVGDQSDFSVESSHATSYLDFDPEGGGLRPCDVTERGG